MKLLGLFIDWLEAKTERMRKESSLKLDELNKIYHFGREISSEQEARNREDKLLADPSDLLSRSLLLSYYDRLLQKVGTSDAESPSLLESYMRHVGWLIENMPTSQLHQRLIFSHFLLGKAESAKVVELWQVQVSKYPSDPRVLGNFAEYIRVLDGPAAHALLLDCHQLEPRNPEWCERLSRICEGGDSIAWAEKWLDRSERKHRGQALETLAYLHLKAGNLQKANGYAFRLGLGRDCDDKHHSETVRGLVALRQNKVYRAGKHLRRAAEVGSTPVLSSFGPSMELAYGLLKVGERKFVLDYLRACESFWTSAGNRPQIWSHEIEEGKIPAEWLRRFNEG
ncbi:MAG: hypothetical protein K2Y32_18105 [Candidatus Obscuribacterales bacterium]|nr:hypothetical protein [Candidatus Obscuribacterales bacterium]